MREIRLRFGVLGEEARLKWFSGGLAASDADDAEDGELGEGAAGDEDAVGTGVEIGGRQLQAVVVNRQEVVRDNAFQAIAIPEAQADPQAVEFGTAEEGFALEGNVVVQIANEIDGADLDEGDLFMGALGSEEVEVFGLGKANRVEITAEKVFVEEFDNNLFVGGSWRFGLQTDLFL